MAETDRPAHRPPKLPPAEKRLGVEGESKPTTKGAAKTGEKKVQKTTKREARSQPARLVRNRGNFPVTVHVGREFIHFGPYQELELPVEVVDHPDMQRHIGKRFGVREKN